MPELHLKQAGFTYSACGPFTKHCQRIQKPEPDSHIRGKVEVVLSA